MIESEHGILSRTRRTPPGVAFSIGKLLYQRKTFAISEDSTPYGMAIHTDGMRTFITGQQNDRVYEYSMNEQGDIRTCTYTTNYVNTTPELIPRALKFGNQGFSFYLTGGTLDTIRQYIMPVPWFVENAKYITDFDPTSQTTNTQSFCFNSGRSKMYVLSTSDVIYQYTLAIPGDVSTASYDSLSKDLTSETTGATDIIINGTKLHVLDSAGQVIYQYTVDPSDISTAVYDTVSFDLSNECTTPTAIQFISDGTELYVMDSAGDIYQYKAAEKEYTVTYHLVDGDFNYLVDNENNLLTWDIKRP